MNNSYKIDYKVKYSEVDSDYKMRLDHIVTHFQDITGLHSDEMEIDGKTLLEKSNAFWVLTKLKMKIHRLPDFDETVEIETWPTVAKGVRFGRDYRISKDGIPLISGTSDWCTLDFDTRKPRRVDTIHYPHTMPHREDRSDAGEILRIRETVEDADINHKYRSSFVDIDTNKHTNNIAYLRMILNCFSPDEFNELQLDELQVSFLSQTFHGDEITVYKKKTDYGFYIEGQCNGTGVFNCVMLVKERRS